MGSRTALVTGGSGGIGTAICRALADAGHRVIANCLPGDPGLAAWQAGQRAAGYEFAVAEGDVADAASCAAMAAEIAAGHGPVDILVNNAGITRDRLFAKMEAEAWRAVIAPEAARAAVLQGIPMQRAGRPDEVASAVIFLCSDGAAYITGNTLNINGGLLMP